ncbi:MAG: hypothetical protein ABW104_02535 [Candidatus Thiodiazotropha sp. 6PLUC2]
MVLQRKAQLIFQVETLPGVVTAINNRIVILLSVALMKHSGIRENERITPDSATLHPGHSLLHSFLFHS